MAKKKADAPASTAQEYAGRARRQSGECSSRQRPKKAAEAAAHQRRSLTSEEIGHVAGDVWRVLSDSGGQTLAALKKSVGAPDELVLAALGWLAREDKLAFETNGRSVTVSLA